MCLQTVNLEGYFLPSGVCWTLCDSEEWGPSRHLSVNLLYFLNMNNTSTIRSGNPGSWSQ